MEADALEKERTSPWLWVESYGELFTSALAVVAGQNNLES